MRLTGFPLLVASSLLLATAANAAARPRYGGNLHVSMRAAPAALDPADASQTDWDGYHNVCSLIFETLVSLDEQGRPKPALAASWQAEPGNQRWQFSLRRGVTFADSAPVTPDLVAASLRRANPAWKVFSATDAVVIERDSPAPDLPAEMALLRNSIVRREAGQVIGTGPFVVAAWDPGKKLTLVARDQYWGGRPFLDSIEIEMGRNFRDQMISFDLGRAQLIEVAPEQTHRAAADGRRVENSSPMELMALVFDHAPQSAEDGHQREALALSIDRHLINDVVLQGGGEPAGGLLPDWMTGYGFLFAANVDLTRAQQERAEVPQAALWTLGFDVNDPVAHVVAERIVLSARDAGLRLQLATSSAADVRLVRIPLVSLDAHVALTELTAALGLPQPKFNGDSVDDLYAAENALLQTRRVIPLLHLRTACAVSTTVKGWSQTRDGSWRLPDAWLAAGKP